MITDAIGFLLTAVAAIFVIVEPVGAAPTFLALTAGRPQAEVRRIALRTSLVGATVLLAFAFSGHAFLDFLGVRIDAFRMAGGLLLLLTALDMLRGKTSSCRCTPAEIDDARSKEDIAIVPLAIPLLSGPGAMAAVMMLTSRASNGLEIAAVAVAIVLVFVATFLVLRSASAVGRTLGPSVTAAVQRVLGLVLAAMSIQFIVEGGMNLLERV